MKKFLAIFVLVFLFSGNANAGVNEPGWGHIAGCKSTFAMEHAKMVKKFRGSS